MTQDDFVLRCCIHLDKTQREIEEDYYFVDLPELLLLKNQARARELLEGLDVVSYPHITEEKSRTAIIKRLTSALPKPPSEPQLSAEEQYQAHLMRMKGG